MSARNENRPEGSSRVISLVWVSVTLKPKNANKLIEYLGDIVYSSSYENGQIKIISLRKDTIKLTKGIIHFLEKESISKRTKDGMSRFFLPFKDILSKHLSKRFGLAFTPVGYVFKQCTEAVLESLKPKIAEDLKAFIKWDEKIDKLLSSYTEKKMIPIRKWLEETTPKLRHADIHSI